MLLLAQVTSEDLAPIDAKGEIVELKTRLKIASLGSAVSPFILYSGIGPVQP